uniref:Uncharacterized protein n=1 Tax=Anopheles funestus TaxID=62324 RepID=A0A182S486_ANOFN
IKKENTEKHNKLIIVPRREKTKKTHRKYQTYTIKYIENTVINRKPVNPKKRTLPG